MAKVLVVGGAGYVGGSCVAWLVNRGHDVWVLDDLSTGRREFLMSRGFTMARAGDHEVVRELVARERFDCVMHFAAKCLVSESVEKPELYFENNVGQTRVLLETLITEGIRRFIFSSTCAIFGDPGAGQFISEGTPKNPINPYGKTKLQVEDMLAELARTRELQSIALRYFNAAGAEPKLRVGEWHEPETHLIPNILSAALDGTPFEIFGADYPTPDGTCIRDYVHVSDLAQAHEAAMMRLLSLENGGHFEAFNLGSETGFSVKEVIRAAESVIGKKLNVVVKPRRSGDPPFLVSNSILARKELSFTARETKLEKIIQSAWEWEKKKNSPRKAIFLDRDGTLNEDPNYLSHPDQVKLLGGVGQALAKFKKAGYLLVVISNQSGVGRGLIAEEAIPRIHDRLDFLLSMEGARIDDYFLCFHLPEVGCQCRKPQPKLLFEAAQKLKIDLSKSYMIGDKVSDLLAGRAAGCREVALVRTGDGVNTEKKLQKGQADFIGNSLDDVTRWILDRKGAKV